MFGSTTLSAHFDMSSSNGALTVVILLRTQLLKIPAVNKLLPRFNAPAQDTMHCRTIADIADAPGINITCR